MRPGTRRRVLAETCPRPPDSCPSRIHAGGLVKAHGESRMTEAQPSAGAAIVVYRCTTDRRQERKCNDGTEETLQNRTRNHQGARGNLNLDPLGSPDYDVVVRQFDSETCRALETKRD
ncbi:hypothetical protein INS49_015602 [Diaporthe citri]|uniref:uncharacterized protein n=1 Tax=Diaporthe citri TaxID=83186 RepID=UPI001C8113B5|nr:uncharacterized protein INS49_015602 [Diaporthe citri]KAG6356215.1 hypothetical protein INS49_015602 [Diaporthe citri]